MKIISTTDLSRNGNDCYIHESISLMESCGIYVLLNVKRYTTPGLSNGDEVGVYTKNVIDLDEAKRLYKQLGGILR